MIFSQRSVLSSLLGIVCIASPFYALAADAPSGKSEASTEKTVSEQPTVIQDSQDFKTSEGFYTGDLVLGNKDAPVTMIEYASLTCHHCADFHNQVLSKLKEKYIDTGKLRYVFRDFPLDRSSFLASKIARCGGKDKQASFITMLYSEFDTWTTAKSEADLKNNLSGYAGLAGISGDTFEKCLASSELNDAILDRRMAGEKSFEIDSTPSIILNGTKFKGSKDFDGVSKAIDTFLK